MYSCEPSRCWHKTATPRATHHSPSSACALHSRAPVILSRPSHMSSPTTTTLGVVRVEAVSDGICPEEICVKEDSGAFVQDDLEQLLKALPADIRIPLIHHPQRPYLLEVILDLGRRPEARFLNAPGGEFLRQDEVTEQDLQAAACAVGQFGTDNRAGIPGTLHRISAIRNRRDSVIGLTCRIGRAVSGHTDMLRDLVESGHSVLLLGSPGVGKTTVIREIARVLSTEKKKRVVIVDTSNEIGGDGDVPHPAIGNSRRMQVPDAERQHQVMIEAVENHMPECIIVDEIGTEAEATACRTIAERGVQLVGTAHGRLLENLIKNPTLSDLVGGVQSVTLGDEAARTRGTQKSILERKAPPTFPIVVEIRDRSFYVAHWTELSVDAILQGKVPKVQVRRRDPFDTRKIQVEEVDYDRVSDPVATRNNLGRASYDDDYDSALQQFRDSQSSATSDEVGWPDRAAGNPGYEGELAMYKLSGKKVVLTSRTRKGFGRAAMNSKANAQRR